MTELILILMVGLVFVVGIRFADAYSRWKKEMQEDGDENVQK